MAISIPFSLASARPRREATRRALRLFVEEMTAAKRRAAVDALESQTARHVAKWFVFQGAAVVRVLGQAMGHRMDLAAAARESRAGESLREDISWSDWDYLLNQVMLGDHPGGMLELRDIITDGRTTAYAAGATETLRELGLDAMGMRISVGADAAVAHARSVAAAQVTRINDTTRGQLRTLITQAVEDGWSWNRTADAIIEKYKDFAGAPLFPSRTFKSRAQMVAAYEIGDAYEAGNFDQASAAAADGTPIEKSWLNAGDARVRPLHRGNAAAGWLPLEAAFPDGSERPPTDAGCRCALMYRVKPGFFPDEADENAPGRLPADARAMPLPSGYERMGKGVRQSPYKTAESEKARRAAMELKNAGLEVTRTAEEVHARYLLYEKERDIRVRFDLRQEGKQLVKHLQDSRREYDLAVARVLGVPDPSHFVPLIGQDLARHYPEMEQLAAEFGTFISSKTLSDEAYVKLFMLPATEPRARSVGDTIWFAFGNTSPNRVGYHEMGHIVENLNAEVNTAAQTFLRRRTSGETAVNLRELTFVPNGFEADETALPDEFLSPYMGKVYAGSGDTEIVSMGLEYMRFHAEELARRDPDYFHFMYHLLRGNFDVLRDAEGRS